MGVTKSKCPCPAKDSGLTAWSISVVKGKHHYIHNDPYTGGERLGRRAKPDAASTANAAPPHHQLHSRSPCASTCDRTSPHLHSRDRASGCCNSCASGHVCASPLHSQDHTSGPHIHHAFAGTRFLCAPIRVYHIHIDLHNLIDCIVLNK